MRGRATGPWLPVVAVAAFLGLQFWLDPPKNLRTGVARVLAVALIPFALGIFLGRREWPKRGRALSRYLLRRKLRKGKMVIYLSERPDVREGAFVRMIEVMGFAAGAAILLASILPILGVADPARILQLAVPLSLFTLWGSFILVPYWVFGRMGLRQVDAERWIVQPVSQNYASRLKLSNGVLLLAAIGAVINLAFRAGASKEQALVDGISTAVSLLLSIFVTAITAVSFYMAGEAEDVRNFEAEVLGMGVTDGRSMADADFLPKGGSGGFTSQSPRRR